MASQNEGFWSRSWSLLTRDEGWFKPLLVLAAAQMVPIVGPFGTDGYALEWGRLTAWGVDAAPKQRNVDVGACIKTGARAFVVALGLGLVIAIIESIFTNIFGELLGGLLSIAVSIFGIVVVRIASLRSAIYQRIGAGYQVNRIYDMIKRDHKGFLRLSGLIAVMYIITAIVVSIVTSVLFAVRLGAVLPELIRLSNISGVDEAVVVELVLRSVAGALPMMFVLGYAICVLSMLVKLIETTSVSLWMRQFDVANWGESADPLPDTPAPQGEAAPAPEPQPVTPVSPTPSADPQVTYPIPQAREVATDTTVPTPMPQEATPVEATPETAYPMPAEAPVPSPASDTAAPFAFPLEADKQDAIISETMQTAPVMPAEHSTHYVTDEERIETIRRAVDATFDGPETAPATEELPEPEAAPELEPEDDDVRQAHDSLDILPDEEPEVEVDETPAFTLDVEEPVVDVEPEAAPEETEPAPAEEDLPTPTAVWPTPVEQDDDMPAYPVEPSIEPIAEAPAATEAEPVPAGPSGTTVMTFSLASAAASEASSSVPVAPQQDEVADEDEDDTFDGDSEAEELIQRISSHEAVIDALDLTGGGADAPDDGE